MTRPERRNRGGKLEDRGKELRESVTGWKMLLAHHRSEELHHCYKIGVGLSKYHFCARCLGLYPAMAFTMVLVFSGVLSLSPTRSFSFMAWGMGIGILEWSIVRLGFWSGRNYLRTITGAIMGVGMGIGFPIYFRRPFSVNFWTVFGALGSTALLVELVARFFFSEEEK